MLHCQPTFEHNKLLIEIYKQQHPKYVPFETYLNKSFSIQFANHCQSNLPKNVLLSFNFSVLGFQ